MENCILKDSFDGMIIALDARELLTSGRQLNSLSNMLALLRNIQFASSRHVGWQLLFSITAISARHLMQQ